MQRFLFNIDVLGSCNLKCPSCPVGNFTDARNPTGFMSPALLDQIMQKATSESQVAGVQLFNWTEPLLHPQLAELVEIVQSYDVACGLSSNLNILKNIDCVMSANPHNFRISVSGFNQTIYGMTHRGGDIERVKKNMISLAESKIKTGSKTIINVLYHRYLGNLDDELLMKNFAEDLGFNFETSWSFMMPIEKVLAYVGENIAETTLTNEDLKLIQKLSLPLREAIDISQKYKNSACDLRDGQMTLDFLGNVQLCCGVYDSSRFTLGSFLSVSSTELQQIKYQHDLCTKCMDKGLHVYFVFGAPEFNNIAINNVILNYAKQLGASTEILQSNPGISDFEKIFLANLKENNLVVFPDWSNDDELICMEIRLIIEKIANLPSKDSIAILIDTTGIDQGDASLLISAALMEVMLNEEIEVDEQIENMLILTKISDLQNSDLQNRISCRISLMNENNDAIESSRSHHLPIINIADLKHIKFHEHSFKETTEPLVLALT
jgi:MoaA/NifB/PqqE/SkfB family radical SAM enzyme/phage tail protein X